MVHPKPNHKLIYLCLSVLFLFSLNVSAVKKAIPADAKSKTSLMDVLEWRSIGPYRGGRVVAVAGHPVKKDVFYFGGTGSGVWKTEDSGETWKNISDGFFKTSSVGAIAVSKDDPNVIYVGMGESCLRGNISHGDGVYKSVDGGTSWIHTGLSDTRHIGHICIHPRNSDIVYAAALGHAFGKNDERGVFRSMDGGKTWKRILFRNNQAGAIDLEMEPGNPRVLYAAFWQVQRFPWGFESGGPHSALYKSSDGGDTWQDISNNKGLPEGIKGRIGLSISAAKPERIWAIIEAKKSGIYRSDDRGKNWTLVSTEPNLLQRPWYYSHIKAHPKDADTIFVMNVRFWKSVDGGKTYKRIRSPHGDDHDLWIDEEDPDRMIESNDGGATVTLDGGKTWSSVHNQPTAQFYHVTTDNRFPYRVYGAQQDNSTISVPSRTAWGEIGEDEWYYVGGCESGYIAVHPENPDIVFAGCYGGSLTLYNHRLQRSWDVSVWPENPMGWGAKDLKYRFQWTFPILFSPHDSKVVYASGNHVFRSTSEGRDWEVVSPDLTRNDKTKMEPSGGPLTKDNTSVEYYGTIFALAESPIEKGLLWAGSDDGRIHISRDNAKTWTDVTPRIMPQWALISIVEPSRFNAGTLYVAATRYKLDDFNPYLYVTRDYGKSWKKITTGIPGNAFTRVIREDLNRKGLLYAGTETGIYFSADDGESWQPLQLNLPVTPVHDLALRNNDLIAGTHGRSFWILDDLTRLYQVLDTQKQSKSQNTGPDVFLFKPAKTIRYYGYYREKPKNAGTTLPNGAIIKYYLHQTPDKDKKVSLTFKDSNGKVIHTYTQTPEFKGEPAVSAEPGINTFVWDLSYPPSSRVKGAVFWGPDTVTPAAVPGTYSVQLSVGELSQEHRFEIVKDPNLPTTQEQFQQLFDLQLKIRDKLSQVHDAVNDIRQIRKQIDWVTDRTKDKPYAEELKTLADGITKKLSPVESALIQHNAKAHQDLLNYPIKLNNKLAALGQWILRTSWGAPTKQSIDVFNHLSKQVDEQLEILKTITSTDVARFNEKVRQLNVPAVIIKEK